MKFEIPRFAYMANLSWQKKPSSPKERMMNRTTEVYDNAPTIDELLKTVSCSCPNADSMPTKHRLCEYPRF